MQTKSLNSTAVRYITVGLSAALVHGTIFLVLSKLLPLWISNLIAFLIASVTSYLGHALFTFREETKGKKFARRWLILQYITNITISSFLPVCIESFFTKNIVTLILVFTPTIINALIWFQAKNHSIRRQNLIPCKTIVHADDFGLTNATNKAIINLVRNNRLDSASLLVNGCEVQSAIQSWQEESCFPLYLHLCLTEGPKIGDNKKASSITNQNGLLNKSFLQLLLISFLPKKNSYRKKIILELKHEIKSQIYKYKKLTKLTNISIDGHQHIHLIPIVLEIILDISDSYNIRWIRSTSEPLASGISLKSWEKAFIKGGLIKWMVLQCLSKIAKRKIKKSSLTTNSNFAGIVFTGNMSEEIISSYSKKLRLTNIKHNESLPMILSHPAEKLDYLEETNGLKEFHLSSKFLKSSWRQKEFEALNNLNIYY